MKETNTTNEGSEMTALTAYGEILNDIHEDVTAGKISYETASVRRKQVYVDASAQGFTRNQVTKAMYAVMGI